MIIQCWNLWNQRWIILPTPELLRNQGFWSSLRGLQICFLSGHQNIYLFQDYRAITCSWRSPRWTQRSCLQKFPLRGSSSLCSNDQGRSPPSLDISLSASSWACQGPGELQSWDFGSWATWLPRRPGIAWLLRIASFHWLLVMIVWIACARLRLGSQLWFWNTFFFPFSIAISNGFLHWKWVFLLVWYKQLRLPILVVLFGHIWAIVYQELYDITMPFPNTFIIFNFIL